LNLLRNDPKIGNEWFMTPNQAGKPPCKPVTDVQKPEFIKFLQTLSLALQRDDLRVVHACWNSDGGPDLFEGIKPHHWMGKNNKVYCVDFSVGLRQKARAGGFSEKQFKLAALRWPEKCVMHDDSEWFDLDDD